MALKVRLSRIGKRNSPIYRVVVQDKECHPKKRFLESVGTYYALKQQKPGSPEFQCNVDRLKYWMDRGAKCSDRVSSLLQKNHIVLTSAKL